VRVDAPLVIPPVDRHEPGVTGQDMGRTIAFGLAIAVTVIVIVVLGLWSRRRATASEASTGVATAGGDGGNAA